MTTVTTPSPLALVPSLETAWQDVDSSFERFCLTAGIGAIEQMLCDDAQQLAGAPHNRGGGRIGHRWGRTKGKIGFHGGKVAVQRPRVRSYDGHEVALPTWTAAQAEDWLGRWAMNLMLINVSTRKLRRAVRLPEGDLPVIAGDGTSKSAASRRFVALSAERLAEWMASDLSKLDLLVIQIDGLHIGNDLVLVAALGIDGEGHKHPLALIEGATENAAVVQALIDNLIERGLDPKVCRLFIIDGAKALSKVIRRTFGPDFLIGVSTHSLEEARIGFRQGADFALFGPIFRSPSKEKYGPPLGVEQLRDAARELTPFPLIALGGISLQRVNECLPAGAAGVAGITLFGKPKELGATVEKISDFAKMNRGRAAQ